MKERPIIFFRAHDSSDPRRQQKPNAPGLDSIEQDAERFRYFVSDPETGRHLLSLLRQGKGDATALRRATRCVAARLMQVWRVAPQLLLFLAGCASSAHGTDILHHLALASAFWLLDRKVR